ncbi:hypothetical protein ACIHCQ_03875 [Streptomyces sp. NPDC052236]|uniref:hypothetical protein n=1 Tax=Streptomyces sp. NPDC052236 TaxID=3365686 RepID=UPI0037D74ED4
MLRKYGAAWGVASPVRLELNTHPVSSTASALGSFATVAHLEHGHPGKLDPLVVDIVDSLRQVAAGMSPVGGAPPEPKPTPTRTGKRGGSLGRRKCGGGAARPTEAGTFLLESWGEPSTTQQTRMRGKRGDGGDSKGEGRPWCVHHRRHLLAASIDKARLERSNADEVDRAQGLPIKVKSARAARKVQLLTGDRHLSRAVDHPSWLGVTCRLAPPGGVAYCGTHKTPDDECGIADGDHTVVLVLPVAWGSPGRTLTGADSKGTVVMLQSRCRGDQRTASQTACKEMRDDLARVPQMVVQG